VLTVLDVNGSRFHLVFGKRDWLAEPEGESPPGRRAVEWVAEDATLRLRRLLFVFPPRHGEKPPDVAQRRGAGRDRYGNWYWISDDRKEIRFLGSDQQASEHFWAAADRGGTAPPVVGGAFGACPPPLPPPALQLSGLVVTTEHYLVVGQLDPVGVLIFDLAGGGPPLQLPWPRAVPFVPFDFAPARDGGVWMLDRTGKALWRLNREFQVVALGAAGGGPSTRPDFKPVAAVPDTAPSLPPPGPIRTGAALSLSGLADPVSVEALPDGSVLVLDRPADADRSIVYRYRAGRAAGSVALDRSLEGQADDGADDVHPLPLVGYDLAAVPTTGGPTDRLRAVVYIVSREGNQTYAFDYASQDNGFSLELQRVYLPMRLFGGKAVVAAGDLPYYDHDDHWAPLLEQPNPRYELSAQIVLPVPAAAPGTPTDLPAFDAGEPGVVWHRVVLDACIPPDADVTIETRASDVRSLLDGTPWQAEPPRYRRGDGAELPFYRPPLPTSSGRSGTWELLLQHATGRYLQLRLTLSGTGRSTPRLQALRIYYPRFSYLRAYLPAVYRDDAASASFLDRYLANVEGFYTVLEGKIEQVQTLFDTRTVGAQYLEWLASWMGVALDFSWVDSTRRLFLAHAAQMFRERGTCAGLARAIRLTLDPCPDESLFTAAPCAAFGTAASRDPFSIRIVERFLTRRAPGVVFGDPSEVQGPGGTTVASQWTPAQGAEPLHRAYRTWLATRYADVAALNTAWGTTFTSLDDVTLRFPAIRPRPGAAADDWVRFVTRIIGFTYAVVTDSDEPLYREFLARHYRLVSELNTAYGLVGASALGAFADVPGKLWDTQLRVAVPASGPALRDWIAFVSIVLPTDRAAHRFTVLVPVGLNDSPAVQASKLDLAGRITNIEKPAHTAFDVKLYWALCRVGEARVGLETVLGATSRSVALVLGRGLLAGSHLGFAAPWNVTGRLVAGRDRVAEHAAAPRL
jgi:phage tail-like protein